MRHRWLACLATGVTLAAVAALPGSARADLQTIADLTPAEVNGLWQTLIRTRGWLGQVLNLRGSVTRTRFRATRAAPNLGGTQALQFDAFRSPWVMEVAHEGLFQLADVSSTGISSGGADVTVTQTALGTRFLVTSLYRITWLPEDSILLVENLDAVGRARQEGTYAVAARSSTRVETEEGSLDFNFGGFQDFSLGFSKSSTQQLSFVETRITGNPYAIERGIFRTERGIGLTRDFEFDLEWSSMQDMEYCAVLVNNNLEVSSAMSFNFLRRPNRAMPMPPMGDAQMDASDGMDGTAPAPRPGPFPPNDVCALAMQGGGDASPPTPTPDPTPMPMMPTPPGGMAMMPAMPGGMPMPGEMPMPSEDGPPNDAMMQPPGSRISAGVTADARANTATNAFLARVRFIAQPAQITGTDESRQLGQLVSHRISIDDLGSEFTSSQTVELFSANQFELSVTGRDFPISIALGSRSLGNTLRTVQRFSLPVENP